MRYKQSSIGLANRNTDIDMKEMSAILIDVLDDVAIERNKEHIKDRTISKSFKFMSADMVNWVKAYHAEYINDKSKITPQFLKHLAALTNPIIVGKILHKYHKELNIQCQSKINNRQVYYLEQ